MSKFIRVPYIVVQDDGESIIKNGSKEGYLIDEVYLNKDHIVNVEIGIHGKTYQMREYEGNCSFKTIYGFFITDVNNRKYFVLEKYSKNITSQIFEDTEEVVNKTYIE